MTKQFLVVKLPGGLYVENRTYAWIQRTTRDLDKAVKFSTMEEAESVCKHTFNGEIEEYITMPFDEYSNQINDYETNIEYLESEITRLKKELKKCKTEEQQE